MGYFLIHPFIIKMNEKTVRLFHKEDWIDINFSIRATMTKTTLNKRNVTEDEINNYVDTLTNTITSVVVEKVPTKSIKRNSMGLPIEIRELICQKRDDFGKRQEYRSTRLTLIVYRNELARTLPPERETAGKSTAMIWSSQRVKMPPGVRSDQS